MNIKYTTTIEIPKSDKTGDQRIYFTDKSDYQLHEQIGVHKNEIKRIISWDEAQDLEFMEDSGLDFNLDFMVRKISLEMLPDEPEDRVSDAWDKWYDKREKLNEEIHNSYYCVILKAKGLPDVYMVNISDDTLKTLSNYLWKTKNHKRI